MRVNNYNYSCLFTLIMSVLNSIEDRQAFHALLAENKGIIILKFGAEWCNPCKLIAPLVAEYKAKLPQGITFYDLDVDDNFEIYAYLKSKKMVSGIPALLAYFPGNTTFASDASISGTNEEQIKGFFNTCIAKYISLPK